MKKLVLVLLAVALFATPALAGTEVTVSLEDLSSTARDAVLKAQAKAESAKNAAITAVPEILKPENAEILATYGTAVASTIKQVCATLNVEVNDFIKTPVGIGVAALVFYKVAGEDMIPRITDFVSKWVTIFISIPLWMWSFRRMHFGRKMKRTITKEDKSVVNEDYVDRFDWEGSDMEGFSYVIHIGIFVCLGLFGIFLG